MIDQYNDAGTSWARFSDDMTMRFHLVRMVSDRARAAALHAIPELQHGDARATGLKIVCFLMLNPSDANAFKNDPTVGECVKFTQRWRGDVMWVVNQHALISPYPTDLKKYAVGYRGDDVENNQAIMLACTSADTVIAAWGRGGNLDHRDAKVCNMLQMCNVKLHCLGTTQDGYPKHPLARGKHRIPADQQPIPWSTT